MPTVGDLVNIMALLAAPGFPAHAPGPPLRVDADDLACGTCDLLTGL